MSGVLSVVADKATIRAEQFPVTDHLVYFNHAAVGPLSRNACQAMQSHASDQMNHGALHWRKWYAEYERLREAAAALIGSESGEISILKNTTEALSFVAEGYRWQRGDNMVTTDLEFPSNAIPWKALERRGVECRIVQSVEGAFSASDIEPLFDRRTRILSLSSAAFHNGFAPDLKAIGQLCRDRNVLFCLDAIQTLGAIRLDVTEANIAFLAADGHKWLLGPEGAAIFYCRADAREHLEVLEHGWMNVDRGGRFLDCPTTLLPDGRRFEGGSLNTIGIYGLRAALDLSRTIGHETIEREVLRLAGTLARGLEASGWTVRTPRPFGSGIVAATPPAVESRRSEVDDAGRVDFPRGMNGIHRWLEDQKVICAVREGMVRFSPHFYNADAEIDRVLHLLSGLQYRPSLD